MRNRVLFGIFAALILALFSIGCYFSLRIVDKRRASLAKYYDSMSQNTSNTDEKLLYLVKSDSLVPKSDKKVNIALLLLNKNEPQKAETYLLLAHDEQANVLLAEYYLSNKPEMAQKYLDRVNDAPKKQELLTYRDALNGKTIDLATIKGPETEVGVLLLSINTGDLTKIANFPLLANVSKDINSKSLSGNQTLELSKYFLDKNQPYISILTLNALKARVGDLPAINTDLAEAYNELNQKDSITYIAKAIELEPENQNLYVTGISYARHYGDTAKADFWAQRLSELQNLQK